MTKTVKYHKACDEREKTALACHSSNAKRAKCLVLPCLVCRVGQGSSGSSPPYATLCACCAVMWCCDLPGTKTTNCTLVKAHNCLIGPESRYRAAVGRQNSSRQGKVQTLCLINYHHNWVSGGNQSTKFLLAAFLYSRQVHGLTWAWTSCGPLPRNEI